jgi:hypothetical protein
MARDAGFSWVVIKAADGVVDFNQGGAAWQGPNLLPGAIDALRAVGIHVGGWQYIYGANTLYISLAAREAAIANANIDRFNFDFWIPDPEAQYKRTGAGGWANTYMTALRAAHPNVSLGLCSYRYPTLHPQLPWASFLQYTDFHCPQVYWVQAHNPADQLRRSYSELMALKNLPFIPVGVACDAPEWDWKPTVAEINEFDQTARALGLPGVTWWEWGEYGHGAEYQPEMWAAITAHIWGEPPAPPPPPTLPSRVRVKVQNANIRNAPDLTPGSDVGGLDQGKLLDVAGEDGDFWLVEAYVAKSVTEAAK